MNAKASFAAAIALLLITAQQAIATPALTEASRVSTVGIGPVRIGMTRPQAEAASGRKLEPFSSTSGHSCTIARVQGIEGVNVMLIQGIIERVDIKNPRILTLSGAKVGDTETRIKNLYPGRIKVVPSQVARSVRNLVFQPKDRADQNYRVVFQIREGSDKIFGYRAGRLPAVEFDDGCG